MWKVDEQTAEQARKILHRAGQPVSFRRGEILMSAGAPSEDVVLIASGSVKVVLSEHTGAQLVAGPYGPGELIAGAVVASAKSVDAALKSLRDDGLLRTRRLGYLLPDPALLASLLQRPGWRPGKRRSP